MPTALEKPKTPKPPRPPLTLRDIGEAPSLMNTGDPRSGKRVRLTVIAFPFPPETQDEWADRHKFALDMNQHNRQFQTIMEVRSRLPRTCQLGLVPCNGKPNIGCTAIIVTSNATPVELERGADLELIRAVQKLLGTRKPPYWVRPVPQWCAVLLSHRPENFIEISDIVEPLRPLPRPFTLPPHVAKLYTNPPAPFDSATLAKMLLGGSGV